MPNPMKSLLPLAAGLALGGLGPAAGPGPSPRRRTPPARPSSSSRWPS